MIVDLHPDEKPQRPVLTDLFGKLGVEWLKQLELPKEDIRRLDELMDIHDFLKKTIQASDLLVKKMVRKDKRC